jgi:Reverse transcriptase (RNA-dependent DNA polymerase)
VQASLKLVLEPVFEQDFRYCSYGFRPNRRAHDALAEIHHFGSREYLWVLEGDIEACFDTIDHTALMGRVRRRIADKRVLALVKAFCKAGILTELGEQQETRTGTPQGGILSPLLANIVLSTLDDYFVQTWQQTMSDHNTRYRRRRKGLANWRLIRYADDSVVMVAGTRADTEALREESGTFGYLNHDTWWRVARWIRNRHARLSWKELRRKVFTDRYRIVADGIELFNPATVATVHDRWRGYHIPTTWSQPTPSLKA